MKSKASSLILAASLALMASCASPEVIAFGDRALTIAERRGVITGADAADARDLGSLLVKPAEPTPSK